MNKVTKEQYEFALARVEELLPLVDDNTPSNDKNAVELTVMSDIVIAYEKEHYPIEKPTVAELIELSLEEKLLGLPEKVLKEKYGWGTQKRLPDFADALLEAYEAFSNSCTPSWNP